MNKIKAFAAVALFAAGIGTAHADRQGDALLGAVLGGGGGAWIGSAYGGQDGAILGGGLGALAGTFLATDHNYRDRDRDRDRRYRGYNGRANYGGYGGPRYYGYGGPSHYGYGGPRYYSRYVERDRVVYRGRGNHYGWDNGRGHDHDDHGYHHDRRW